LAGAVEEFLKLAETLRIPVLTTWKTIDIMPETHELFAGRPGSIGQRGANFTQQNSDWLLSLGARLDYGQTAFSHANFARGAKKIMVDIDPAEINKMQTTIDVPVQADAGDFIREMARQVGSIQGKDRGGWLKQAKAWQARYPVMKPEYWNELEGVNTYVLMESLSDAMAEGEVVVPGSSGTCSEITMQAFKVKAGMRVFNTEGLGSMGFGIPASIGGCLASGGQRTVCVDGDGGFIMNIQDLETVKRLNLPIKYFILNNNGYASIRAMQRNHFKGHLVACDPGCGVTLPDFCKVAGSFGIASARIDNHSRIREQVREILAIDGPVVCEVMISPAQQTMPRVMSMQKPDGSMVSKPMEDMYPFLPREEFLANMIIEPLPE
jgi:acetolactate synthase-1/2/3 large subunit